jgi:hypothetical protein
LRLRGSLLRSPRRQPRLERVPARSVRRDTGRAASTLPCSDLGRVSSSSPLHAGRWSAPEGSGCPRLLMALCPDWREVIEGSVSAQSFCSHSRFSTSPARLSPLPWHSGSRRKLRLDVKMKFYSMSDLNIPPRQERSCRAQMMTQMIVERIVHHRSASARNIFAVSADQYAEPAQHITKLEVALDRQKRQRPPKKSRRAQLLLTNRRAAAGTEPPQSMLHMPAGAGPITPGARLGS